MFHITLQILYHPWRMMSVFESRFDTSYRYSCHVSCGSKTFRFCRKQESLTSVGRKFFIPCVLLRPNSSFKLFKITSFCNQHSDMSHKLNLSFLKASSEFQVVFQFLNRIVAGVPTLFTSSSHTRGNYPKELRKSV